MAQHFGLICSPVPGHINPMATIGRELLSRGHRVTMFNIIDTKEKVLSEGLEFIPVGEKELPRGSWIVHWGKLATQTGLQAVWGTIVLHRLIAKICCDEIPFHIKENKIDALLIDQCQFQGASIAKVSGIPFISINCALPMNQDPSLAYPPPFAQWKYSQNPFIKLLNFFSRLSFALSSYPIVREGDILLKANGHAPLYHPEKTYSAIAQIIDLIPEIDFPKSPRTSYFEVGPYLDQRRPVVSFPWDKIDGRPIVYASFGTLQNGIDHYFKILIEVFNQKPEYQLVLSLGKWRDDMKELQLSSSHNMIVVPFVPQLEIIEKSHFIITHAGVNTALECLFSGKPMICLPITNDQPAMAARISFNQLGITLPLAQISTKKMLQAITDIESHPQFFINAKKISALMKQYGGVKKAADIIEEKIVSK